MSTIALTRRQRRHMQKLAEIVDRVSQADRRFFERRPDRRHRLRLASQAEIGQQTIFSGEDQTLPEGFAHYVAVKNIATGVRLRAFCIGLAGRDTDVPEAVAGAVYESALGERGHEIEERLDRWRGRA